jgi:hypothetical protein
MIGGALGYPKNRYGLVYPVYDPSPARADETGDPCSVPFGGTQSRSKATRTWSAVGFGFVGGREPTSDRLRRGSKNRGEGQGRPRSDHRGGGSGSGQAREPSEDSIAGDVKLDLVAGNTGFGRITAYLGNGDGTFRQSMDSLGTAFYSSPSATSTRTDASMWRLGSAGRVRCVAWRLRARLEGGLAQEPTKAAHPPESCRHITYRSVGRLPPHSSWPREPTRAATARWLPAATARAMSERGVRLFLFPNFVGPASMGRHGQVSSEARGPAW